MAEKLYGFWGYTLEEKSGSRPKVGERKPGAYGGSGAGKSQFFVIASANERRLKSVAGKTLVQ